jgi:dTDP-4-amino-4,6-dideoxygalactose transaminase
MAVEQAMRTIPITKPDFGPEEAAAIQKPLETGWVVQGPYVTRFEERFCDFTGAPFAAAAPAPALLRCTSRLQRSVSSRATK